MTHQNRNRFNIAVILIFCISNILNLWANRGGVAGDMSEVSRDVLSRSYIQVCYVLAIILMLPNITRYTLKSVLKPVVITSIIVVANLLYWKFVEENDFVLGNYIRMLTNFVVLIFFYKINVTSGGCRKVMQIFCLTLLASLCYKIVYSAVFTNSSLGAGDTASIGIVFLIPLIILCFKPRVYLPLIAIASFFILLSVRRTSIVALAFALICLFDFKKIKIKYIVIGATLLICVIFYAHQYVGEQIATRFGVMMSHGSAGSIGSGREYFYVDLLESYINSDGKGIIMGKGLGSIGRYFENKGLAYLNHAHNDYLELLYTFGLVGLSIWLFFLFSLYKIWKQADKTFYRKVYLCALLSYLVVSLLSGCLLRIETLPFMFTLSILIPKMLKVHRIKKNIYSDENIILLS